MEQFLIETCKIFIKTLEILKAEGKITSKQYKQHVKIKMEFLEIHSKSSTYNATG